MPILLGMRFLCIDIGCEIMTTTQFASASYQEVIDLSTTGDTVSAIGIHTPCSATPVDMLSGFWRQFQKVRYDGCSVTLVPAARLPVDPLGVSYEAGEATIDPRDLLNPILFHGCHGNDMGYILNQLYSGDATISEAWMQKVGASDSTEQLNMIADGAESINTVAEALYYKALTDNTWKKADPQRGFKKSGLRPLVHDLAVNVPFGVGKHLGAEVTGTSASIQNGRFATASPTHPAGSGNDDSIQTSDLGFLNTGFNSLGFPDTTWTPIIGQNPGKLVIGSNPNGIQFMTNRLRSLGWLDTRSPLARIQTGSSGVTIPSGSRAGDIGPSTPSGPSRSVTDVYAKVIAEDGNTARAVENTIPKIFMGMILLPPAYKTKQYFRMVINHRFSFAKFRGISMNNMSTDEVKSAYAYYDNYSS
ncbi:cap [Macaca mulatta feces associated virus 10]|uniref:Cap n=1 Tax=Macaca mulatta feces associated virus 10 TaxID=2499232 RepID=A0A1W5PX53_9VIRU|nr:cap [Macaca mulatta feces associated virus 10]APG55783.1 cap [Macaca mulatta feces associated virus 10]